MELFFFLNSPEEDVDAVDVATVESDWVGALCGRVLEAEEVVGDLRRSCHFTGAVQAQNQQVHHQAVVLHDEGGKLKSSDDAVGVGVVHVLKRRVRGKEITNKITNESDIFSNLYKK